ncbi:hypothetical protein CXB34_28195 [Pseudomonas amygdali pv. morsprunorum]|uniref:TrfB-related DNA-binding protein n=1 Tax=Pseudomonas amygdali TaxID=47877 RepID=UPI000CDB5CB0|nr:TrfB-related DNA-binding protein [Pseudomonas amygdali]POP75168.1 hypothetical protein CXB34_28195 [Pseudomonas amygdali pv. morsprunorum]
MKRRERLTPVDFESLKEHMGPRWKPANIEAVRQILVEGKKQIDVATELSVTTKAVSNMVKKAYELHQQYGAPPQGWVKVVATLPADMAEHVKLLEQSARLKLSRGDES